MVLVFYCALWLMVTHFHAYLLVCLSGFAFFSLLSSFLSSLLPLFFLSLSFSQSLSFFTFSLFITAHTCRDVNMCLMIVMIIQLIHIALFDTNGILTALYIIMKYIQTQSMHIWTYVKQSYLYTYTCLHICTYTDTCIYIKAYEQSCLYSYSKLFVQCCI